MTDCRLLTIILILGVIALLLFVFKDCKMECKGTKREGLDLLTDVNSYEFANQPQSNPFEYKYGFPKKQLPLELSGAAAYQRADWFGGMPEDIGPQSPCGPCE